MSTVVVSGGESSSWTSWIKDLLPVGALILGALFLVKYLKTSPIFSSNGVSGGSGIQTLGPNGIDTTGGSVENTGTGYKDLQIVLGGPGSVQGEYPTGNQISVSRTLDPSEMNYLQKTGQVGNQWLARMGIPLMPSDVGSASRYAIFTGKTAATAVGNVVQMVSGRDSPQQGQTAYYNPATGQAWGGNSDTVDFLYNSNDPAAVAWRARYG